MNTYKNGKILKDLTIFFPREFRDHRGCYVETFNKKEYNNIILQKYGEAPEFIEDDISESSLNVLRGLHGDDKTWKLIQCLKGQLLLVVVDMRPASPTYQCWESFSLSSKNREQVLIPPNFVNGHLCMSHSCIFSYKQSAYYTGADTQITVRWDDPAIGIDWPTHHPILSNRDKSASSL